MVAALYRQKRNIPTVFVCECVCVYERRFSVNKLVVTYILNKAWFISLFNNNHSWISCVSDIK